VRFISTHLDHTSDPSDRIAQAKSLLRQAFPPDKKMPATLLLGDMNAQPGSEPMRIFLEVFASAAPDGIPSFPSETPVKAIDWVLYTPVERWQVVDIRVLDEPHASDHAPLRAVLRCD
jgi:endonuclease/exonuclease/phosphatase family metal-dependent hydrolase